MPSQAVVYLYFNNSRSWSHIAQILFTEELVLLSSTFLLGAGLESSACICQPELKWQPELKCLPSAKLFSVGHKKHIDFKRHYFLS